MGGSGGRPKIWLTGLFENLTRISGLRVGVFDATHDQYRTREFATLSRGLTVAARMPSRHSAKRDHQDAGQPAGQTESAPKASVDGIGRLG